MTERRDRFERLLGELESAVGADAGAALYLDDGQGVLELVATGQAARAGRGHLGRLLHRGSVQDGGTGKPGRTLHVVVPDVREALLVLQRRGTREFSTEDRALARLYARQLASEVVVSGVQPRAGVWTRQLEAIQSIAAQLTRIDTLQGVATTICAETLRVIEYDNARVYVLADDGVTLEPVAFRSQHPVYSHETADTLRLQVGQGIAGWVAQRGTPLVVRDASRDPRWLNVAAGTDAIDESMLLVPMRHEEVVIGVIVLARLGLDRFDDDDLRLLQVLSDQATVAIENARLLAGRDRLVAELAALLDISQATGVADDEEGLAADPRLQAGHGIAHRRLHHLALGRGLDAAPDAGRPWSGQGRLRLRRARLSR